MKKWIFLLLVFLVACGGNREMIQVTESQQPKAPTGPVSEAGGADVGGGNSIQGKMIEEYQVDVTEILEYQEAILPIMKILQGQFPDLAADFLHIAHARKWYIVPADLKSLDALKIGIPLEIQTEQVALHTPEKIFIDRRRWEVMSSTSKAYLLLHEIVMGIKWIDKHEGLDRCLARARKVIVLNEFVENESYKDEVRSCYKTYPRHFVFPTKFKFTPDDYESIRSLVTQLGKKLSSIDWEELKLWFASRDFRKYN